jgi:hypothetical protein
MVTVRGRTAPLGAVGGVCAGAVQTAFELRRDVEGIAHDKTGGRVGQAGLWVAEVHLGDLGDEAGAADHQRTDDGIGQRKRAARHQIEDAVGEQIDVGQDVQAGDKNHSRQDHHKYRRGDSVIDRQVAHVRIVHGLAGEHAVPDSGDFHTGHDPRDLADLEIPINVLGDFVHGGGIEQGPARARPVERGFERGGDVAVLGHGGVDLVDQFGRAGGDLDTRPV